MASKSKELVVNNGDSEKISTATAYLMIGTALAFDTFGFIINFIPVIGQIITVFSDFIGYGVFLLWFIIKGVKLMTKKRLLTLGGGFLISFIPFLDMLPELTVAVIITILSTGKGVFGLKYSGAMMKYGKSIKR